MSGGSGSILPWIADGVAVVLILGCALAGLRKGALRILGAVAGVIAAVIIAWRFTPALAELVIPRINSVFFGKVLSFLAIFIGVMIVVALLVFILSKLFDAVLLGWLNKVLGFLLGLVIGIFIAGVLVWATLSIFPDVLDVYSQTRLVRMLMHGVWWVAPAVKALR